MPDTLERLRLDGKRLDARVEEAILHAELERTIAGASTITIELADPERDLLKSRLFARRVRAKVDDDLFELAAVSKAGDIVTVIFESAGVAELRRQRGKLVANGHQTRTEFAERLVRDVGWLHFRGDPGDPALRVIARGKGDGDKNESSWQCLRRLSDERRWRLFEDRGTIYFGSDEWLLDLAQPFLLSEIDDGVDVIDFDFDKGKRASTATITCNARLWAARPGAPVEVEGLGPLMSGRWLMESLTRSFFSPLVEVRLIRKTRELVEPKPDEIFHDDTVGGEFGGSGPSGPTSSTGWQWPAQGVVSSEFGDDRPDGRTHAGIDIAAPIGTSVRPGKPGTIVFAGVASGYGNVIYMDHGGGVTSRYAHLSSIHVATGQSVGYDSIIGKVGSTGTSTGPHLHFEIRIGGGAVNPRGYLP